MRELSAIRPLGPPFGPAPGSGPKWPTQKARLFAVGSAGACHEGDAWDKVNFAEELRWHQHKTKCPRSLWPYWAARFGLDPKPQKAGPLELCAKEWTDWAGLNALVPSSLVPRSGQLSLNSRTSQARLCCRFLFPRAVSSNCCLERASTNPSGRSDHWFSSSGAPGSPMGHRGAWRLVMPPM